MASKELTLAIFNDAIVFLYIPFYYLYNQDRNYINIIF